jgi:hypothetical protein
LLQVFLDFPLCSAEVVLVGNAGGIYMSIVFKNSIIACASVILMISCSNENETQFSASPAKPVQREKDKALTADATATAVRASMVPESKPVDPSDPAVPQLAVPQLAVPQPIVTQPPASQPVVTQPAATEQPAASQPVVTQPVATEQPATSQPPADPTAPGPAPTCVISASTYRIAQDATVQLTIHATNAVGAAVDQIPIQLDANQSSVFTSAKIGSDHEFVAVVKSQDQQTGICRTSVIVTSKWYKSNFQSCNTVCSSLKLTSIADPQGSICASGENNANPVFNKYVNYYPYGTWGSGRPTLNTINVGGYCYANPLSMQTRDNDPTDKTTGCYCKDSR